MTASEWLARRRNVALACRAAAAAGVIALGGASSAQAIIAADERRANFPPEILGLAESVIEVTAVTGRPGAAGTLCSGVVVGSRVVLTLRACLVNAEPGQASRVRGVRQGVSFGLECREFGNEKQVGVCRSDIDLPGPHASVLAENDVRDAPQATPVYLVGLGCTENVIGRTSGRRNGARADLGGTETDGRHVMVTNAAACFGDAGGAAFMRVANSEHGRFGLAGLIKASDLEEQTQVVRLWSRAVAERLRRLDGEGFRVCGLGDVASAMCSVAPHLASSDTLPARHVPLRTSRAVRAGETLYDVLFDSCGSRPPFRTYLNRVVDHLRALDDNTLGQFGLTRERITPGMSFSRDVRHLELPSCPAREGARPIYVYYEIPARIRVADLQSLAPVASMMPEPWPEAPARPTEPPRRPDARSRDYVSVFLELNPSVEIGQEFLEPNQLPGRRVVLPLRPADVMFELVATPPGDQLRAIELLGSDEDCGLPEDSRTSTFNTAALARMLARNAERRGYERLPQTDVLILDSGLHRGVGPRSPMERTLGRYVRNAPLGPSRGVADRLEPMIFSDTAMGGHGTEVASVVLGGPDFVRTLIGLGGAPPIRISPVRVLHEVDQRIVLDREVFEHRMKRSRSFAVVNLSLSAEGSPPRADEIEASMHGDASLFVVAAGNGRMGGNPPRRIGAEIDTQRGTYPQRLAGSDGKFPGSIVAVAATVQRPDGSVWLAPFSDYGRQTVEIGAAGCAVPVLTFEPNTGRWTETTRSGTSFAAPQVSFVAALLTAEVRSSLDPADLQNRPLARLLLQRLLASADLHGRVSEQHAPDRSGVVLRRAADGITDGRVLNPVKALAVHDDVVELPQRGRRPGRVVAGEFRIAATRDAFNQVSERVLGPTDYLDGLACRRVASSDWSVSHVQMRDVLKIAPRFRMRSEAAALSEADPVETMIYVRREGQDYPFDRLECRRLPDHYEIRFMPAGHDPGSADGILVAGTMSEDGVASQWFPTRLNEVFDYVPRLWSDDSPAPRR